MTRNDLIDLLSHLITRNDTSSFNDVWDFYFSDIYYHGYKLGKCNREMVEDWLREVIENDKNK